MLALTARSYLLIMLAFVSSLGAEEISLEQAIDLALINAPEIKIAESQKRAQQRKSISSWLELGPRASLSYNHIFFDGPLEKSIGGGPPMLLRDETTKSGSLTITQPITGLFALGQRARLETRKQDLKETALSLSKAQMAFKIAELYIKAQQSESMWRIATASIIAREAQKKDGEALFRAERIHNGDLLKFELGVSQAQLAEAKAKSASEIARFSLLEMIGLGSSEKYQIAALNAQEYEMSDQMSLDDGLSLALDNRLEVKQARQGEEIASIGRLAGFSSSFLR